MRSSNRKVVTYLLSKGFDDIWLKPHGRRQDLVYAQGTWYRALDLWNLFDGICFDKTGHCFFIQIKTNAWASKKKLQEFKKRRDVSIISFNVKLGKDKKWKVLEEHL